MPLQKWEPKTHKKKKKLHVGLLFPILLSLVIPILSVLLFPNGEEELGGCVMLIFVLVASLALAIDSGIWLWLLCVFEAALWPIMTISFPELKGDFSTANLVWLGGRLIYILCFCLVLSAMCGLGLRSVFRAFSSDD